MKHDTKINVWKVNTAQLKEIMEEYPAGILHPDGICYRLHLLHCDMDICWFCDGDATVYAKELLAGEEE